MQALIGLKKEQGQRFLENGKRIPVTLIDVKGNTIVALKTQEKDKYQAVQLGFSMKKKASRAELGHAKGAKLDKAPKFLREVKISDDLDNLPEIGSILNPIEVFEPGDMVDVSGFSKGKGFQGGVKRWGFHGGPKTHGQSDRHRAPGSIGQGTTPGRVYKGKKMAGNMGNDNVTIKNLEVIDITNDGVLIVKGLVPGIINGPLMIFKTGKDKNFVPLQKTPEQIASEEKARLEEESSSAKASEGQESIEEVVAKEVPAENAQTEEASVEEVEVKASEKIISENPTEEFKTEAAEENNDEIKKEASEEGKTTDEAEVIEEAKEEVNKDADK